MSVDRCKEKAEWTLVGSVAESPFDANQHCTVLTAANHKSIVSYTFLPPVQSALAGDETAFSGEAHVASRALVRRVVLPLGIAGLSISVELEAVPQTDSSAAASYVEVTSHNAVLACSWASEMHVTCHTIPRRRALVVDSRLWWSPCQASHVSSSAPVDAPIKKLAKTNSNAYRTVHEGI